MMIDDESIFKKHYEDYLVKLGGISLPSVADRLGGDMLGDSMALQLFDRVYTISPGGIAASNGQTPGYDVCVILSRYLLMCPRQTPEKGGWAGYRDFRDSGPLVHYFSSAVEGALAAHFSGNLARLKAAAEITGATAPPLDVRYDLACQFSALPRVPLVLLFNDADATFPATCSILFERRAQDYLDAECLAMLGHRLMTRLKRA